MTDATFNVGDQVRIKETNEMGRVERLQGEFVTVRLDAGPSALFDQGQIEKITVVATNFMHNTFQVIVDLQETIARQASEIKRLKDLYESPRVDAYADELPIGIFPTGCDTGLTDDEGNTLGFATVDEARAHIIVCCQPGSYDIHHVGDGETLEVMEVEA